MNEHPLHNLSSLHLNNNDFREHGLFSVAMAKILMQCSYLKHLNLHSCRLGGSVFEETSPLRAALQASCVSSIDISDNCMEGEQLVGNFFNSVNHKTVKTVDISRTIRATDSFDMTRVWTALSRLDNIKDVSLSGLPNRMSGDFSCATLEHLNLQYQDQDGCYLSEMSRRCLQLSHLTHLDPSFSNSVDNALFEMLLQDLQRNSTLKTLLLKCCAIRSPLNSLVFDSFPCVFDNCLSCLDISFNDISSDDMDLFLEKWKGVVPSVEDENFKYGKCIFRVLK